MEQFRNLIAQLGPKRLIIMGLVAAALLAVLGLVALRGEDRTMAFLFTDLDPTAAAAIGEKLRAQNIPFQLSADGSAVMAPQDKVAALRMTLAGDRLGGKIGYDVLDAEQPFGVSAARAKLDETRAIEGELARSIQSIEAVTHARVHLVMPERQMFAAEARRASAAVTVKTRGRLPAETIQAIRYLVASAVPDLSPEAVSIVDQTGALLARAGQADAAGAADADARQTQVEAKLRDQIEALLEPIVGQGKVRAEVSAQIDRDQTREDSTVFDPDKQVIAHQTTVDNDDQNRELQGTGAASVATQLPEAQGQPAANGGNDTRQTARKEASEDTTYANSATHSVVVRAPGKVNRLTVAVMVDGGTKGLPAAQIQRLTRLVENTVGLDAQRGDSVVVESMAFAADQAAADAKSAWWAVLTSDQLVGLVKLLVIAGVGLIALRMIRARREPLPAPEVEDSQAALADQQAEMLAIAEQAAGGDPDALRRLEALQAAQSDQPLLDHEITVAQVDGRVKASVLKKIGDSVASSPPEAAAVLRQWMNA
ncbi:flagellar basal-body MS-ring/collar protein FliF [Sphingomonas sp. TREG-RG-20F-R18-01]|uniref:flagellar basal-body MS-ring/collar protein FliF n=1 Tax=Sphingomonas sp. TREG-RG-20F-R18-01 TaxID=2914982 RepID=UPI001F5677DB|nr:flagellar basal-body MS-ring/collar protein FliF [Sphingomonas sp. TREG-RG-20F-R18-01]